MRMALGMAVGFISPLLRSIVFGMPSLFPEAVAMAFEMGVYGAAAGFLYHILPKKNWSIYAALLIAMTVGRFAWGGVHYLIAGLQNTESPSLSFWRARSPTAIPGIILHIVLIPMLVMTLKRLNLVLND